jgi:hypothetical protein
VHFLANDFHSLLVSAISSFRIRQLIRLSCFSSSPPVGEILAMRTRISESNATIVDPGLNLEKIKDSESSVEATK